MGKPAMPCNLDAEQGVLGSMIIDHNALVKGLAKLNALDFYRPAHQRIFEALMSLYRKRIEIDPITITEELRKRDLLEDAGGTEYIMAVVDSVPTAANIDYYAGIVNQYSTFRKLLAFSYQVQGWVSEQNEEAPRLAVSALKDICSAGQNGYKNIQEVIDNIYNELDLRQKGIKPMRIPFSLKDLNKCLRGGPAMGDLLVVGMDTSHGKTVLLSDIAVQAADANCDVLVVTLEMSNEQYLYRMLTNYTRTTREDWESENIPWDQVSKGLNAFYNKRIRFIERALSVTEVEIQAELWAAETSAGGRGLLVIDYAALLKREGKISDEHAEMADRIRRLKALAKSLNIVVATASQFRKEPNTQRKPRIIDTFAMSPEQVPFASLDDLIGSSEIRSSADIVILGYNPPEARLNANGQSKAFFLVAKHRNGRAGQRIEAIFTPKYTRFDNIDSSYEE